MIELRTRKREMRGDGTNHHEKLGLHGISCVSQLTITDTTGMSLDLKGTNTNWRLFQPNQASYMPDFSNLLISSTLFLSSSLSLPFLSPTLWLSLNKKLSNTCLSLHAMIMSWHQVQHTPSTAYTEYSIHRVQHTPKIVCLSSFLMITT